MEAVHRIMLNFSLTHIPEEGLSVDAVAPLNRLRPVDAESLPMDTVTVRGTLTPAGSAYLFQGALAGVFCHACDRCLEDAETPVNVDVLWTFEEVPVRQAGAEDCDEAYTEDDDDSEASAVCRTFQGQEIDLGPYVWEEMALAMPVKFTCRPDCQGLCPWCGKNRNFEPCACETEHQPEAESQGSLAGLAELFPDLAKKKPEE